MRLNRAMGELLARLRIDPNNPPSLVGQLRQLLEPGIRVEDGCWLLVSQLTPTTSGKRSQFPDRTGYEAFVNHIHVVDALETNAEGQPEVAVGQALALGHAMAALVAAQGAFEVVISTSPGSPADCNVRLYRKRPGEVWIEDDLEGYADEGILVIEAHVH